MLNETKFKEALGAFCSGVTIITMKAANGYHGLTVSAFTSVSLDPPLVLFCRKNTGNVHKALVNGDRVVINVLSREQQNLALKFANPKLGNAERFDGVSYRLSEGVPILMGSKSVIEASIHNYFMSGDHTIFVCEVYQVHVNESVEPLVYYDRGFYDLMTTQPTQ